MKNKPLPVVSTEREQQTKIKNKSELLSSMKSLSTSALMSLFLLMPKESAAQNNQSQPDSISTDSLKTEQIAPVKNTLWSVEKEKTFVTNPEMFTADLDGPDAIKNKVQNALNDSTNIELQIFKSVLGGVSTSVDKIWTTSFAEAKLWWNAKYHLTNWSSFSSKWVLDLSIMGKDVVPLGLATAELIINPTENITISWGYVTTPSTAGRMSPFTVLSGFENAWQKLMGPHTIGTWVKVDYASKNNAKGVSLSAWVFDINGATELNASAKYKWVRLSAWKNSNATQVWWSIWINIGNSSGTFTLDNGKFWGGANISLSPTVNIYGGFSGELNPDNTGKTKVSLSEPWGYKTLHVNKNTVIVAAGYNPNTKTLNLYLVILIK